MVSIQVTAYGLCVSLSLLSALTLLGILRGKDEVRRVGAVELALWCTVGGFLGARLLYCVARAPFYLLDLGPLSMLQTWRGGFLLYGAMIGAVIAAALCAKHAQVSVALTLDELAAPGLLMIALCRLAEGTTREGVGAWIENEAFCRFPLAVMNDFGEWRLAVFMLEMLAALIALLLVLRLQGRPGLRFETALLLYACAQIVLESLRKDSCLRFGFVRFSQVLSAVAVLLVTLLRAYRTGGVKKAVVRGGVMLACTGAIGALEWALDKTPVSNALLYAAMIAVCAGLYANASAGMDQ